MKLYDNAASSACARVRIALAIKGQHVEKIPVAIGAGAGSENRGQPYLQVNPQGLVPALLLDDGMLLTQSLAIVEYLEQRFPAPALLPDTAEGAAQVRAIALVIAAETHPLLTFRIADYVNTLPGSDANTMPAWRKHWISEGFTAAEALLARRHAGAYASGNTPGLADIFLYPQAVNALRAGMSLEQWPTLAAIMARLKTLPAFVENGPPLPV